MSKKTSIPIDLDKKELFATYSYQKKAADTGSPESQIALWSQRISSITEHLLKNKKDTSAQLGLKKLVGKRQRLLKYLAGKSLTRYKQITKQLGLRRKKI